MIKLNDKEKTQINNTDSNIKLMLILTAILWICVSVAVCYAVNATSNIWCFLVYILLPTPSLKRKKDGDETDDKEK